MRTDLSKTNAGSEIVRQVDTDLQMLLQFAGGIRAKKEYRPLVERLQPRLLAATIEIMKSRDALLLSTMERSILETLRKMLPVSADAYEQVLRDLASGERVSWRGTGSELREVLREVMDHLAPDEKVMAAPGFQIEPDRRGPTQKQKVRHILKARRLSSTAVGVAEATLSTVDEAVATLARSTYERGSATTHARSSVAEIRSLKRYVDALLAELLEIAA